MKHAKLILAGAIAAAAWCGVSQAQTVIYGVEYYDNAMGTGSTPSIDNTSAYPKHPANVGYAVSEYWDNGVLWQRTDPVAVQSDGTVTYVYPETARMVYPPSTVIYSTPGIVTYPEYEVSPKSDRGYSPNSN